MCWPTPCSKQDSTRPHSCRRASSPGEPDGASCSSCRTDLWTDIKPGSLYNVLHRMEKEGFVEVVRIEREGNPPERTVYGITATDAVPEQLVVAEATDRCGARLCCDSQVRR